MSTFTSQHRGILVKVAAVATLIGAALVTGTTGGQASTAQVRVYFAICEGSGSSDTIKIKRINEDGTNVTTIGDTTIAYCQRNEDIPDRYFSGLAVHNGYAYFSWFKADNSAAGIGRISTTEPGTPDLNFAVAPASVYYLQLAPRVLNNYLYLFAYDETPSQSGPPDTTNERVMRVALTGGEIQTCFTPPAPIEPRSMAIGVGKDAVHYALTRIVQNDTDMSQELYKVASDCSSSTEVLDLGMGQASVMLQKFQTYASASFMAESDTRLYMATESSSTPAVYGISHLDAGGTVNDVSVGGTATSPDNSPIPSLVWGINRLYFKNSTSTKMYAVTPGQQAVEVFADQMTGTLHHISVVSETPPTTTTTTTTSTTTTTVPLTTTTTVPTKVATRRTTTLKTGATVKPLVRGKAKRSYTAKSLLQLPKGVTVTRLTTSTKSVCSTRGTTLRAMKKGTCRYSVRVVHKKRTTTLRVTMKVS